MRNYIQILKKIKLIRRNWQNFNRTQILDIVMDFCLHNQVTGGYFEFGVYQGNTFQYAYHTARLKGLTNMKFYAFDSFQGFSSPQGGDDMGLVIKGGRSCSLDEFKQHLTDVEVNLNEVTIFPGWFADTLRGKHAGNTRKQIMDKQAAVVYLDADLFEPTKLALDFITPYLTDGSVVIFDNWFLFKAHPDRGERKAFSQWQKNHPKFKITPYYKFGWHGMSFILNT